MQQPQFQPDFSQPCSPWTGSTQGNANRQLAPHPGYTMNDMNPTTRDPRCSSNTKLACFWPVYVGNFKGPARGNVEPNVRKYFASRGLHVRWFFQRIDEYYHEFQTKAGLYDMLVYFVSERDAKFAIEHCHRDAFEGYTINVFPGREPVYFDPARSVHAEKMKSGRVFSEHFFEKHVIRYGVTVDCVVKFDIKHGALEFARPEDVVAARLGERMWTYLSVTGQMQKQRFLEQDLIDRIELHLTKNPNTLETKNNDQFMRMLLKGERPFVDPNKMYKVQPLRNGPSKYMQRKLLAKKRVKQEKYRQKRANAANN